MRLAPLPTRHPLPRRAWILSPDEEGRTSLEPCSAAPGRPRAGREGWAGREEAGRCRGESGNWDSRPADPAQPSPSPPLPSPPDLRVSGCNRAFFAPAPLTPPHWHGFLFARVAGGRRGTAGFRSLAPRQGCGLRPRGHQAAAPARREGRTPAPAQLGHGLPQLPRRQDPRRGQHPAGDRL